MSESIDLSVLEKIFHRHRDVQEGALASYIPELGKADPSRFSVSVVTVSGQVFTLGDADATFTLQSISKPFVYGLALEDHGHAHVHSKVGVEPTGEAFNSIIELEKRTHRPFNPMVNAGAIAVSSLIRGGDAAECLRRLQQMVERYTGRPAALDQDVFESERVTGHRNRAIAHLLRHFGVIEQDIEQSLNLYFQQCSLLVNTQDLAMMAATLANNGVQPVSGTQAIAASHVRHVLSLMFSCGMYDSAGEWAHTVGIPAKSGVSGGLLGVVPGRMGIACYSPLLDGCGHSVRGVRFFKDLSERYNLSLFDLRGGLS